MTGVQTCALPIYTTGKSLTVIGSHNLQTGSVLPVFNGALVNNKTLIFRGADPISVWYEAATYD